MIKNKLLTLGLLLLFSTVFAQKPSLTKAYNYYYEKDFANAKEAIDLCTQDAKLSTKASTWLYKGNIYFYIANEEFEKRKTDENYIFIYPDAASEAYKAFLKAKESLSGEISTFLPQSSRPGLSRAKRLTKISSAIISAR